MAVGRAMLKGGQKKSKYETQGILTFGQGGRHGTDSDGNQRRDDTYGQTGQES
jgi:hypothetical protein